MTIIGERIKARRMELGMSQRDLAGRMGYSNHSTITRIEAGKVDLPQSRIMQFAKILGVSEMWLMGFDTQKNRSEEQKKNDAITDAVVRMRKDADFFEVVSMLAELPPEQYASVKTLLNGLRK